MHILNSIPTTAQLILLITLVYHHHKYMARFIYACDYIFSCVIFFFHNAVSASPNGSRERQRIYVVAFISVEDKIFVSDFESGEHINVYSGRLIYSGNIPQYASPIIISATGEEVNIVFTCCSFF